MVKPCPGVTLAVTVGATTLLPTLPATAATGASEPAALPTWLVVVLAVAATSLVFGGILLVQRRRVAAATAELRELNAELEARVARRTTELTLALADLEDRIDATGRFARDIAHDLRGPSNALVGLVGMLQDGDVPPQLVDETMARIRQSAERLNELISTRLREVLDSHQPETTGEELTDWVRGIIEPEVELLGGDLRIDVPPGRIDADASVLRHALLNLVGNALKYGGGPGGLHVSATLGRTEGSWELFVRDRGPGVAPEIAERMFEEGFQGNGSHAGAGLGLAVTLRAVREAGGHIELRPTDEGALFVVTLPATSAEPV